MTKHASVIAAFILLTLAGCANILLVERGPIQSANNTPLVRIIVVADRDAMPCAGPNAIECTLGLRIIKTADGKISFVGATVYFYDPNPPTATISPELVAHAMCHVMVRVNQILNPSFQDTCHAGNGGIEY